MIDTSKIKKINKDVFVGDEPIVNPSLKLLKDTVLHQYDNGNNDIFKVALAENGYIPSNPIKPSYTSPAEIESPKAEKTYEDYYQMQKDYIEKYINREDFSYDVNADELYKTFRQQALAKAETARRDATARAAGLTGGYGSTYAGAVGNAAYDSAMQSVDDIIPELYNAAYTRYQNEGSNILNKASLAGQMGDNLYNKEQLKIENENKAKDEQEATRNKARDAAIDPEGKNAQIITNMKNLSTTQSQLEYITKMINAGYISEDEGVDLLDAYKTSTVSKLPLNQSTWNVVSDGGVNIGGINRDATVKNENGVEYTLGQLFRELKKTMTAQEARQYIYKLQEELGIQ